jgi:spermidine/putrescine-binding protein
MLNETYQEIDEYKRVINNCNEGNYKTIKEFYGIYSIIYNTDKMTKKTSEAKYAIKLLSYQYLLVIEVRLKEFIAIAKSFLANSPNDK